MKKKTAIFLICYKHFPKRMVSTTGIFNEKGVFKRYTVSIFIFTRKKWKVRIKMIDTIKRLNYFDNSKYIEITNIHKLQILIHLLNKKEC